MHATSRTSKEHIRHHNYCPQGMQTATCAQITGVIMSLEQGQQ